jgi:choline dehydrogenase
MPTEIGNPLPRSAATVIVGAGPAGAVLAARLAETGEDALLLEAGPDYGPVDSGRWPERLLDPTLMPVEEVSWEYTSACQRGTPKMALQRARVIGGCSSHNGAAAVWGHRSDYDGWAEANPGWSAADLEPLFRVVSEKLRVHVPPREELTPYHQAVLDASAQAGYPSIPDLSSLDPEFGFAIGPVNIDPATKLRWNAAFAYLDPVRHLPNLRIAGDTLVDKLTLDGPRVTGLDVVGPAGPAHIAAERVILPGVGRGLQDHPAIGVHYEPRSETVAALDAFVAAGGLPREEGTIGLASSSRCQGPYDLHLYPIASRPFDGKPWRCHISGAVMAPRSRGTICLNPKAPTDPAAPPLIDTAYFSDPEGYDLAALADAFLLCRELGAQPAIASLFARELTPGPAVASREQIEGWILAHASHDYHPAGTCRMGPATDPAAVVDASGRVHGVEYLLVADAAIMPFVTLANTNLPTFVGAEKIARDLTRREAEGGRRETDIASRL